MLLLHGWGGNVDSLRVIARPLSEHRQVHSLALPGFGNSPEPSESWGTYDYVEVVARWIVERGESPIDLIAHSFGGRIAVGLASQHPELVKRLVLIGSAGLPPQRSLKTRLKLSLAKLMKTTSNLVGGVVAEKLRARKNRLGSTDWRNSSPVMRGTLSRVLGEDLSQDCRSIKAPTLLIWGENDTATPPVLGRRMAELIEGSELHILPASGHYVFLDKTGDVISIVWRHLNLPAPW